jgi:tyrosine-protein phosphatase SIW14
MSAPRLVTPTLWRSGQPVGRDWKEIHQLGVRHVLKLNEPWCIDDILDGMTLEAVYIPDGDAQNKVEAATLEEVDRALDRQLAKGVTLVHCQEGKDRAGIAVARYRVRHQRWSKDDAWDEWVRMGSHGYRGLVDAWRAWNPP